MFTGPSAVNSFIVGCGNGVQALASLAATILVSRRLGPGGYGIFALALGAATTITPIMDFGLHAGLLRNVARSHAAGDHGAIARSLWAYAEIQIIFFVIVAGAGWALSGWLARDVLKFPHLWLLRGAIVGAMGLNLLACGRGLLEACQRFLDVALVTASTAAVRLIAIAALIVAARLTPSWALFIYLAVPALGLLFALPRLPGVSLSRPANGNFLQEKKELFNFGGWIGVLAACSSIAGYLDMTLLNRSFDVQSVGLYAAAYRLASVFLTLSFPLAAVLRARASTFQSTGRLEAYLGKAKISAVLAGLGIVIVWAAAPLIVRLCLGPSYEASIPLLRILAVGTGIMFASSPFSMAFYAFGQSRALALLGPTHIVVFFSTLKLFIPRFGIAGAAWAFSLTQLFLFLLTLVLVREALKSQRAGDSHE